jgi:hypothetical protein
LIISKENIPSKNSKLYFPKNGMINKSRAYGTEEKLERGLLHYLWHPKLNLNLLETEKKITF